MKAPLHNAGGRRSAWAAPLLSLALPGLGQFLNGERRKGIVFAGSFLLLFGIEIYLYLSGLCARLRFYSTLRMYGTDEPPSFPLRSILLVLSAALAVWALSALDAMLVARKRDKAEPEGREGFSRQP